MKKTKVREATKTERRNEKIILRNSWNLIRKKRKEKEKRKERREKKRERLR